MKIERKRDSRVVKSILHRIADVPGGVTVKTAELGGKALIEGTPLALGSDAMHHVTKTAKIVTLAADDATTYEVAKGHHFKVGDYYGTEGANGQQITAIDKTTNADKDIITLGTTLGVEIPVGTTAFETAEGTKVPKYAPKSVAGSSYDIDGGNLFVDAWLIAVVNEANAPAVNDTIKATLKGVVYS